MTAKIKIQIGERFGGYQVKAILPKRKAVATCMTCHVDYTMQIRSLRGKRDSNVQHCRACSNKKRRTMQLGEFKTSDNSWGIPGGQIALDFMRGKL